MGRLNATVRAIWARPAGRFVVLYAAVLVATFAVMALKPVDAAVVVPFTSLVAEAAGEVLGLLGEDITVRGCELSSPRFAVTIFNGCNGLVTSLVFAAGVVAFPARWRAKVLGLVGGLLAIQIVNLVRIVSLYYIGVLWPAFFVEAHVWLWQSIVVASGVALWVVWARTLAAPAVDDP